LVWSDPNMVRRVLRLFIIVLAQRDLGVSLIFKAANYDGLVPATRFGHCSETSQTIKSHKLDYYNAKILHACLFLLNRWYFTRTTAKCHSCPEASQTSQTYCRCAGGLNELSGSTIAGATDLQYLAALLNQPVAHFSSRAKKVEVFLKYRYPAVVDECPLPIGRYVADQQWTAGRCVCSAVTCFNQRRTVV